ncbi:hypothetical protein PYW07_014263 [Mythimna separata]|uniref:Uncharacterized protein n=1 Tax=Mythimna separata TaxID=271217 RepID=A0AAD7YY10_MYTSE|nr:hypothetical protein PYW07_014263 [Mythimna separata]
MTTKQLKITRLFGKRAIRLPEDCDDLQDEIQRLELQLKEKQDEMFQLQRNSYRHKASPMKKKGESFVRPEKLILTNAVSRLKKDLELMSVLSGIEVQSYVPDDHCCIVYHMQHAAEHEVKHGLRIETKNGLNEVSKLSLPLGFNLEAVMENYDNIMLPECLVDFRKALVAYHSRQKQFDTLKRMLNSEAELYKVLDGSQMQISFVAQNDMDEDAKPFDVELVLDYRINDIRPKQISFKETDLPEGAVDVLRQQCAVFKKKSLSRAFRDTFIDGAGPYKLVKQVSSPTASPRRRRALRPHRRDYNNDDTFLPEHCSEVEHSDGDDE